MTKAQADKSTHAPGASASAKSDAAPTLDLASQVEALLSQVEELAQDLAVPAETLAPIDVPLEPNAETEVESEIVSAPAEPNVGDDAEVVLESVAGAGSTEPEPSVAKSEDAAEDAASAKAEEPTEAAAVDAVPIAAAADAPAATDDVAPTDAPVVENIDELDQQLASLTDNLISEADAPTDAEASLVDEDSETKDASEAESDSTAATEPAPAPVASKEPEPVTAAAVTPVPAAAHAAPAAAPVSKPAPQPAPELPREPAHASKDSHAGDAVAAKPVGPSVLTLARAAAFSLVGKIAATIASLVLKGLSAPLRSQPVMVRDTLGWVALATMFWAGCLWAYMLLLYKPPMPEPPSNAVAIVEGAGGGHGAPHGTSAAHGEGGEHGGGKTHTPTAAPASKAASSHAAPSSHKSTPAKKDDHAKTAKKDDGGGGHGGAPAGPKKFDKPILDQFTAVPAAGTKPAKKEEPKSGGH